MKRFHVVGLMLVLLMCACFKEVRAQDSRSKNYSFKQFTTVDGLPSDRVYAILEDRQGYIWLGTELGLLRYDGYSFEEIDINFQHPSNNWFNYVSALFEDHEGHIWIGGIGILERRDPVTGEITQYLDEPETPNSLSEGVITTIYESENEPGIIWIGSTSLVGRGWTGRLHRLEVFSGVVKPVQTGDLVDIKNTYDIFEDRSGVLWFASWGLHRYDHTSGTFTSILLDSEYSDPQIWYNQSYSSNHVYAIHEDVNQNFWLGTGVGLVKYDREQNTIEWIESDPTGQNESSAPILDIYEDQDGLIWLLDSQQLKVFNPSINQYSQARKIRKINSGGIVSDRAGGIWVGSYGEGVYRFDPGSFPHTYYSEHQDSPLILGHSAVKSIYEDKSGNIWVGSSSGTLDKIDPSLESVSHFQFPSRMSGVSQGPINGIYQDTEGDLWVSSMSNGLSQFDVESESFEYFRFDSNYAPSFKSNCANPVLEDSDNNLWFADPCSGLYLIDANQESVYHFNNEPGNPASLATDYPLRVLEDSNNIIWIAHGSGLSRFERKDSSFVNYLNPDLTQSLMMLEDRRGRFWVASKGQGLVKFDRETGESYAFTTKQGLSHNNVLSVLEDNQGKLWLGTSNGLSRFDPDTEVFRNYYTQNGLPGNSFNEHAFMKSREGELFFGGPWGMISFFPGQVHDNSIPPRVHVTKLLASGNEVSIHKSVRIPHSENDLEVEYVGLHFENPSENQYQYMLKPVEEDWIDAGIQRRVRYPNLPPGEYEFLVKASNSDGVWSDPRSLAIVIAPPWYRTLWAYGVYGLLFIGGVIGVDRFQRRRLIAKERLRAEREKAQAIASTNTELERALKHLTETQDQLIHTEKMASLGQLTAGVAHEIKNPLNFVNNFAQLCVGQAEDIEEVLEKYRDHMTTEDAHELKSMFDDLKVNASKINEHGHRADGIIRSMLEHSRAEAGEKRPVDINQLLDEYVNLSYHAVRARTDGEEVTITRDYANDLPEVHLVPQEIGRVFINLLDNAFYAIKEKSEVRGPKSEVDGSEHSATLKENPSDFGLRTSDSYHPEVKVTTRMNGTSVQLSIQDNGTGIPKDIQSKIFEPFFTTKPTGSGTGLGLSLSYDIVTQGHGGSLSVESEEGEGAVFVICLPV